MIVPLYFAATSHWMQEALGRRCNFKSGITLPPTTFPSAEEISPLVMKDDQIEQHSIHTQPLIKIVSLFSHSSPISGAVEFTWSWL